MHFQKKKKPCFIAFVDFQSVIITRGLFQPTTGISSGLQSCNSYASMSPLQHTSDWLTSTLCFSCFQNIFTDNSGIPPHPAPGIKPR